MSRKHPTKHLIDILPKATLYTYGELRGESFGYDRREVRLFAWGFTSHAQYARALRVMYVPKGMKQEGDGLSLDVSVFTVDCPVILQGWNHPVPPPPFRPGSGGDESPNEEFADMLLSYYRTDKPSVLLADFTEHSSEPRGLPQTEPRTPLIPEHLAHVIPRLGGTEGDADPVAHVHLHLSDRSWHWYLTEYDPGRQFARGLVISPGLIEVGDFAIDDLEHVLYSAYWKAKPVSACKQIHARDE